MKLSIRFFAALVCLTTLFLFSGCLTGDGTASSDDSSFLVGTWASKFDNVDGYVDTIEFYASGTARQIFYQSDKFNGNWVPTYNDTSTFTTYGVNHGMVYFVEPLGTANYEFWQKYVLKGDTMTWYKGGLFHGGKSGTLVGSWQAVSVLPDTTGSLASYIYEFKSNGVLYVSHSGVVYDSLTYTQVGSKIQRSDLRSSHKDTLGFEFDGGYLRLYNPSANTSYFRVKR